MQSIKMSLMPQVLRCRQLQIDTLRLKHHSNFTPQSAGIYCRILTQNDGSPPNRKHQRRKNAEHGRLPAAIRPQQPKKLRLTHIKRNPIQRSSPVITMDKVDYSNDWSTARFRLERRPNYSEGRHITGQTSFYDEWEDLV